MNYIEELEHRYQTLFSDFQAGKIDEATFIAEVDGLQIQDDWGRYWMIGAQTGSWHYYDGQAWHQADPRDADKLPFVDEQGIYWQRGAKSGDWYFYDSDAQEWVKPSREDNLTPPMPSVGSQRGGTISQWAQSKLQPTDTGPQTPAYADGELFQDDEGRYWSIGAKTGQWYFYDHDGWHPAHEFYARVAPQVPQPPPYPQPQSAPIYPAQPYQPQHSP